MHREAATDPVRVVQGALARARKELFNTVIVDTSGRLQVDDALMAELVRIRDAASPDEVLLVADAMTGQNAVEIAKEFHEKVTLTGVILSQVRLRHPRRGGALGEEHHRDARSSSSGSARSSTAWSLSTPQRIASRILGMGDVVTLVEKAQKTMEVGEALEAAGQAGSRDLHAGGHAGPVPADAQDGQPPVPRGDDSRAARAREPRRRSTRRG